MEAAFRKAIEIWMDKTRTINPDLFGSQFIVRYEDDIWFLCFEVNLIGPVIDVLKVPMDLIDLALYFAIIVRAGVHIYNV